MINVNEYIKLVLSKKKWSNRRLCKEINRIEEKLGDSRTSYQNITNYLNFCKIDLLDIFKPVDYVEKKTRRRCL